MSNDTEGFQGDLPPRRPGDPYGYGIEPPAVGAATEAVRDRVRPPAICLIIVGVLNLLLALLAGGVGGFYAAIPQNLVEQEVEKQNPAAVAEMKNKGLSIRDILNVYIYGGFGEGALGLVSGILAIVGGARMFVLKSYGLAVFASVVTAIPCISCSGCCGLGEGIGIWALVVLLNEEVKAAFR
jgi:hypothetical protein